MIKTEEEKIIPFSEDYWMQDGGQKWAELIDETEATLHVFNEKLLEHSAVTEGEVVLDVGCGGGLNSIEIANRVGDTGQVIGIDISPDILVIAVERGKHLDNLPQLLTTFGLNHHKITCFDVVKFAGVKMVGFSEFLKTDSNNRIFNFHNRWRVRECVFLREHITS